MVPTTLISLEVGCCTDLQRVSGAGGLTKLKILFIDDCPKLKELPGLSRVSSVQQIEIDSSEKLENIAGIEELHSQCYLRLFNSSNEVIRNCIHELKIVPLDCLVIGRAVDGAESTLNQSLFSDAIGAVIDIILEDIEIEKLEELRALLICFVVVVDSSASVEDITKSLRREYYNSYSNFEVRQGEWIITMVVAGSNSLLMRASYVLRSYGIIKKGLGVEVKKGEEWKILQVLHTIVDRLHHS